MSCIIEQVEAAAPLSVPAVRVPRVEIPFQSFPPRWQLKERADNSADHKRKQTPLFLEM